MKQIILLLSLAITKTFNCEQEQTAVVFFSKTHEIETSSSHCGGLETGLIYTFVKEKYKNRDSLLYGFIPCPEMRDQHLFVYNRKLKIKYKNFEVNKVNNLVILNAHRYKGKIVYWIADIK